MALNVGIIGLEHPATTRMIPAAVVSPRVRLVALADGDRERLEQTGQPLGVDALFADYRALLERRDVDLVYIATPSHLRAETAIAAARAGKHVLCEQPMATNAADGERLVAGARASGVKLAIGYTTRHHPVLMEARRRYQSGTLGPLRLVRCHFSSYRSAGADESRPAGEQDGGGPLLDMGAPCLDTLRFVLGEEVAAVSGYLTHGRGWEAHDCAVLAARLRGGAPALIDVSFDLNESGFDVIGDGSSLIARGCYSDVAVGRLGLVRNNRGRAGWLLDPEWLVELREGDLPHYHLYVRELEAFCDCIEEDREPENSGLRGLDDLRVLDEVSRQGGLLQ
ncbi:MAG: Gfo/Idh/MocA family oxidoreductase [Chloroflexi bacterium]|nr:Gfo/Idh/MocA family oxidoreductase [Chloroflexota bacterium]